MPTPTHFSGKKCFIRHIPIPSTAKPPLRTFCIRSASFVIPQGTVRSTGGTLRRFLRRADSSLRDDKRWVRLVGVLV